MMLDMVVIMQFEARAQGLKRYYTGKPCRRGHIAERYASCGMCTKCGFEAPGVTVATGFDKDPMPWRDDGGALRVSIYDHNVDPPRLIRRVGWVNCLSPQSARRPHRFLSPDVVKVRTCDQCKRSDLQARSQLKYDRTAD
jgi:hypothetical protein